MARQPIGPVRRSFRPWADPKAVPLVSFEGVTKRFGAVSAVDRLDLQIYEREFFALLGPSGCGKTTLMRLLAGFETPDEGRIRLSGRSLAGVPPHRRPVNLMFQSYALFPHMSVWDNVAFGLRQEGMARAALAERVEELLALVKLEGLGRRRPHQLSGGQRQRVALARSLAKRPKVLLLDEPLAALDRRLREATQFELMDLQVRLGMTFMIVTHDQEEAMAVSDRMAVMDHGRIVQIAPPEEIYETPVNRTIAEFVGEANLIAGHLAATSGNVATIDAPPLGSFVVEDANAAAAPGAPVWLMLRPEKLTIAHDRPEGVANTIAGEVFDVGYLGDVTMFTVKVGGGAGPIFKVSVANRSRRVERPIAWEDRVWLSFPPDAAILLTE